MKSQHNMSRRTFVKTSSVVMGGLALGGMPLETHAAEKTAMVFFCPTITPESLVAMYEALNHPLKDKVAVKISTGEPGGHNFLQPALIAPLVNKLHGTIVECCTAYKGRRLDPKEHWKAIEEHGFKAIAPCDIMDEFGDMSIPVKDGFHLKELPAACSHSSAGEQAARNHCGVLHGLQGQASRSQRTLEGH